MSSFAKAHKAGRKTHKERSQPSFRKDVGFLEKKKDWKLRREDYHFKEKRIKALAEKARNRNPDEFYFAMINSRTKEGIHQLKSSANIYTPEEVLLLKTQDTNYLNLKLAEEGKKIERLQSTLHMTALADNETDRMNEKTVFVADKKSKKAKKLVKRLKQAGRRPMDSQLMEEQSGKYNELAARIQREKQLTRVKNRLETQKNLLGKGRKRKIEVPGQAPVYVWARERKR
eukprot:m.10686 g.10686  ORF g.10686 m.10686 type:complete len:230 (-) comp6183_c0_seq1:384-1073(-)